MQTTWNSSVQLEQAPLQISTQLKLWLKQQQHQLQQQEMAAVLAHVPVQYVEWICCSDAAA